MSQGPRNTRHYRPVTVKAGLVQNSWIAALSHPKGRCLCSDWRLPDDKQAADHADTCRVWESKCDTASVRQLDKYHFFWSCATV